MRTRIKVPTRFYFRLFRHSYSLLLCIYVSNSRRQGILKVDAAERRMMMRVEVVETDESMCQLYIWSVTCVNPPPIPGTPLTLNSFLSCLVIFSRSVHWMDLRRFCLFEATNRGTEIHSSFQRWIVLVADTLQCLLHCLLHLGDAQVQINRHGRLNYALDRF